MRTGTLGLVAGIIFAATAALAAYGPPNYMTQGSAAWEIGGLLEVLPGGTFRMDTGTKTATATTGAATLNKLSGVVTSEALTTASGASYVLNLTDARIAAADLVFASVANGTNTTGGPQIARVTPGAGAVTIEVRNATGAGAAFNGTVTIAFMVLKN